MDCTGYVRSKYPRKLQEQLCYHRKADSQLEYLTRIQNRLQFTRALELLYTSESVEPTVEANISTLLIV